MTLKYNLYVYMKEDKKYETNEIKIRDNEESEDNDATSQEDCEEATLKYLNPLVVNESRKKVIFHK